MLLPYLFLVSLSAGLPFFACSKEKEQKNPEKISAANKAAAKGRFLRFEKCRAYYLPATSQSPDPAAQLLYPSCTRFAGCYPQATTQ
jgi:hypothetical protein